MNGSTAVGVHAAPARQGLRRHLRWLLLSLVAVTGVLTAALPLAPVERTTATVDWPVPGEPLESTMLTLLPYRPLALDLEVPCDVVRASEPGRVLFSTFPVGSAGGQGLSLEATGDGRAEVVSEGVVVWSGAVPASSGCTMRTAVEGERTRVLVDGTVQADVRAEPPRVASLATSLPPATDGVAVRLEADSRYETSPSAVKRVLLVLCVLGAVVALVALGRLDRGRPPLLRGPPRRLLSGLPQDLVVLAVLGTWALIGPMMADDGYNVAVANAFGETGYVGNYYHWYNAPEAPFALVQQAFVPLADLTRAPVVLRLPALLAALTTWLLLSRVLLPRLGGGWRTSTVRWVAVPVLLAWWMPFNNSLRPEPWVALAGTAVLAFAVLAAERGRVLLVAVAATAAALSLAAAPSGLMAAAPLLVLAPRLLQVLRASGDASGVPWWVLGAVAVVPAGVVAGVAVFADQPLSAVLEATRVHQVIGPAVPWWQDVERYRFLFGTGEMGTSARRLAVLATLFCLGLVLVARRALRERGAELVLAAAGCYGVALVLLVAAPSKWTHHFGGTAGFAVLLVVGLAVHGAAALREERAPAAVGAAASFVAAGVVAAGFAGPNVWWAYGSLEVDPQLPPVLASPVLWLAVGAAAVGVLALAVTRRRPQLVQVTAVPATVVVLALALSAAVMVHSHATAARALSGGWSMTSQNVGHLTGDDCGMGDHLQVQVPQPLEELPGLGEEEQTTDGAFLRGGGAFLPGPGSLPPEALRWGTLGSLPGEPNASTGTLTTSWFAVPDLGSQDVLGVLVSGRTGGANEVALEFADRRDPDEVLASVPVGGGLDGAYWQQATAALAAGAPGDVVRVVATDATTDLGGWLAVSQPVVVRPVPLAQAGRDRSVHVDWTLRLAFPCLPQVPVAHGLAQLPDLVLTARPRVPADAAYGLALDEDQGGAFAMARQASAPEVLPTRLPFVSVETVLRERDLGTLSLWLYPYPRDRFRLTLGSETVPGWEWGYHYPVPVPVPDPATSVELPGPRLVDKALPTGPELDTRPGVQPEVALTPTGDG